MDKEGIKELIKLFDGSQITRMNIEIDNLKMELEKQSVTLQPTNESVVVNKEEEFLEVKSPLVGTFYQAASPQDKPFIQVGDHVNKGDVIGIIEAMKVMNEVKSQFSGIVERIEVKDGDLVQYDDVMVLLREDV